jgi:hypothetical protein
MRSSTVTIWIIAAALIHPAAAFGQPSADGLEPFRASYGLYNGDKQVGDSVFTLSYDPHTRSYTFETRSEFRGLLHFAAPRPVIERSRFVVVAGTLRPDSFDYEDGTRGGRRNFGLRFDHAQGKIEVESPDGSATLSLSPGTLDRATARIALMRALDLSRVPPFFDVADEDEVQRYANNNEGTETVATGLGPLTALRIVQQRAESSRRTVVWAAPDLHSLAVRIEQQRDDREPVTFALEAVEWLADGPPQRAR